MIPDMNANDDNIYIIKENKKLGMPNFPSTKNGIDENYFQKCIDTIVDRDFEIL